MSRRDYWINTLSRMPVNGRVSAAIDELMKLEATLDECLEYFEDRYDVIDGDYGQPAPNKEMRMGQMIEMALRRKP